MKRILILLFSVTMLVTTLTACGNNRASSVSDTPAKAASEPKNPTEDNKTTGTTNSTNPQDTQRPASPTSPVDSTRPASPTSPVDSTKPESPTSPVGSTRPASPTSPTKPNPTLAQKNGPKVTAVYWEDGELEREAIPFSEAHPYFTDKNMTWILDLNGNTVTLATVLVLDTNVSIVHGTIKTTADAYIENNRSFSAGEMESYQFQPLLLESEGLGIQNNADLYLRSMKMTVHTGIGISNAGTLCHPYIESFDHYSIFKVQRDGSEGTTCLQNSGELHFGAIALSSSGGIILHNEASGIVYPYNGGKHTVTNGTAIFNEGTILREKNDVYNYYCHECTVHGGYAIENYGTLNYVMNIQMAEGTAIRNYPEGSLTGCYYKSTDSTAYSVLISRWSRELPFTMKETQCLRILKSI